jgi:hypothetical protein
MLLPAYLGSDIAWHIRTLFHYLQSQAAHFPLHCPDHGLQSAIGSLFHDYCSKSSCSLVGLSLLLLLLASTFLRMAEDEPDTHGHYSHHLHALSRFIIPANGLWPPYYQNLHTPMPFTWQNPNSKRVVRVGLNVLLKDIQSGVMEVRNTASLIDLIHGKKHYGWTIQLEMMDFGTKLVTANWLLKSKLPRPFSSAHQVHVDREFHWQFSHLPTLDCDSHFPSLYLDIIPFNGLENAIDDFLSKPELSSHSKAIIEFSCLAPQHQDLSFSDPSMFACALPLIASETKGSSKTTPSLFYAARTTSPLKISLLDVVSRIQSRHPKLNILSIENVSLHFSAKLRTLRQVLEEDRAQREWFIDVYGLEGWREKRFLLGWEAALLDANMLVRWIVAIQP